MWKLSIRVLSVVGVAYASNDPPPSQTCATKDTVLLQAGMMATKGRLGAAEPDAEVLPEPAVVKVKFCKSTGKASAIFKKVIEDKDCDDWPQSVLDMAKDACECSDRTQWLITQQTKACAGKAVRAPCTLDLTETVSKISQKKTFKTDTITGDKYESVCDDGKCVPFARPTRCAGKPDHTRCINLHEGHGDMDITYSGPCTPPIPDTKCANARDGATYSLSKCMNGKCQEGYNP